MFRSFFISGNHDSRERLAFGAALFEKSGVYMAGEELCKKIRWKDEYGELNIWLMPFLKPAEVRMVYSEKRDQYLYGCGTGSAGRNGD